MNFDLQRHRNRVGLVSCKLAAIIFMIFAIPLVAKAQSTIERTVACQCIDNDAPLGSAQFYEELTVQSDSDTTWYIIGVAGLYQTGSPVPPAAQENFMPGPDGDTLLMVSPGTFVLEGIHIESVGYNIYLTNSIDTLMLENIVCAYPSAMIEGDNAVCDGEVIEYINTAYDSSLSYNWNVGPNGEIIGSDDGESIIVDWDDDAEGGDGVFLYYEDENGCGGSMTYTVEFEKNITLSCNNDINHTINPDCTINIKASDVLESMEYNELSYEVSMKLASTGQNIPQGSNVGDYLNQQIEVSVFHTCGINSCWGYVTFEDKYIPDLECTNDTIKCFEDASPQALGLPLPVGSTAIKTGDKTYDVYDFDACGIVTLTYVDDETVYHCSTDFYSDIIRTWTATDESGNSTSCKQNIKITRSSVDDVVFPGNWDGITNPILECDGSFPKLPNGFPDPSYTGSPSYGVCPHLTITYLDLETNICGATYKLIRKWKVFDPCENQTIVHNQIIKVSDDDAPVFYCPQNITTIIEDQTCEKDFQLNIPSTVTDCSDVDFISKYYKLDKTGNIDSPIYTIEPINGVFYYNDLTVSDYKIELIATDECGNASSCSFILTVKDKTPPTAICDAGSAISLGDDGIAVIPAVHFDGGSFDNCSDVSYEIRRMNSSCGPNSWGQTVQLCCNDVDAQSLLQLRVTDASGNMNTCMFQVNVQDKKPPIINCPQSVTVNCGDDTVNLDQYGSPIVHDNCDVIIEEEVQNNLNVCGVGNLIRTFTAIDPSGNTASCTQYIHYINQDPLTQTEITWPLDTVANDCSNPGLLPDSLEDPHAYPKFPNKTCSEIGINFLDKVFTNYNGYCKTIFREWTLLDKCNNKQYTYTQKLYINDDEKPVFTECSNKTVVVEALPNCSYQVNYTKEAVDNCSPQASLIWSYDIDIYNDGFLNIWNPGNSIDLELPAGVHKVIWRVEDECGNFKVCTEIITVVDQKPPTPYCIDGISTVVMESTGSIEIWASDFNLNSEDNCTPKEDLTYSFSENINDTNLIFTCDDLGDAEEKLFEVEVYVFDNAGNYDYCTTTILITSNNHCDGTGTATYNIMGNIKSENNDPMPNVALTLRNMEDNNSSEYITDDMGNYSFQDLDAFESYEITASYEDDYINGITTLDIVFIQKHILAIKPFDSPYKLIAADVNASESISGTDIVQLRKLILGHYDELPNNTAWRFVNSDASYTDPTYPWPIQDKIYADPLMADMNQNLVSIKIGDVNNSAKMGFWDNNPQIRTDENLILVLSNESDEQGNFIQFEIEEDIHIEGIQFGLKSDQLELVSAVSADQMPIGDNHLHIKETSDILNVSWSQAEPLYITNKLFKLYTDESSIDIKDIALAGIQAQAYVMIDGVLSLRNIELKTRANTLDTEHVLTKLKIYQNEPNPFNESTTIRFFNPKSQLIQLEIRDLNGRIIHQYSQTFAKGENTLHVDQSDLDYDGMMIYTISGSEESRSGKMMRIQ